MGLDEIRQEINCMDEQMKRLFLRRMDLAHQVAEEKKRTGAAVYAPEREREIICMRTAGTGESYAAECRAFFKQLMEISRAYQYAQLSGQAEELKVLPAGEGETSIAFSSDADAGQLSVFLNAAFLAGLTVKELTVKEEQEKAFCRLRLSGDFSSKEARGAILQMLRENKSAAIMPDKRDLRER